jgi:hypothetical protein
MSNSVPASPSGAGSARSGVPRPIYREPVPARPGFVLLGAGAGALWMLLFGLLAHTARGYVWWALAAGAGAWIAAFVLARIGDRGVAAGVAMASGVGVAIAISVVLVNGLHGHWVL